MLQNLETALAGGFGQMSLVNWLPNVSTQSRVFVSGTEIQGMVTAYYFICCILFIHCTTHDPRDHPGF